VATTAGETRIVAMKTAKARVLHEDFDAAPPGAVLIAHALGDLDLQIECQLLGCAPGCQMHVRAHRPEKIFCLGEEFELFPAEQAQRHQFGDVLHLIKILGDPEQRLQVAQPAFAFLYIGFDHVTLTLFQVAFIPFGQLGLDEFAGILGKEIAAQPVVQLLGKVGVTG